MSRIYTNIVTVGNVDIYNVLADPNGVLQARIGSLAIRSAGSPITYQNIDGATTWVAFTTGSPPTPVVQKQLSPTLAIGDETILQANGTDTFSFTATEDCTLKQLIFEATAVNVGTTAAQYVQNNGQNVSIDRIEVVSGTGPDVGRTLLDGTGVSALFFTSQNLPIVPELNIRLDAGDVVEIDLTERSNNQASLQFAWTYESGYSGSVLPKRILGGLAPSPFFANNIVGAAGSAASLTVASSPAGAIVSITPALESTLNLSPAGGPRSSGSNDYDNTLGTVTAIRDDMLAAFQDPANAFAGTYSFAANGADGIDITRNATGAMTNYDEIGSNDASVTVTPFSGGTSDIITTAGSAPSSDVTITDVYMGLTFGGNVPRDGRLPFAELTGIDIASSATEMAPARVPGDSSRALRQQVNETALTGASIEVRARYGGPGAYPASFMIVANQ
jgi:hypothetical protein